MRNNIRKALLATVSVRAFDNRGGWKKDADGKLAVDANGNPIYVDGDGRELVTEAGTIARLNGEAKQHREAKETAETKLKAFEGLDPVKAKDALDIVGKLDHKKLIDAGEVDKVKAEITGQFTTQLNEYKTEIEKRDARINEMTLSTAFSKSEFIRDRVAVPPEMFEAQFCRNFKVEDGKPVAYDAAGNRIMSEKRFGEVATVDEAFEILVKNYAHKDQILKPEGAGGTGNGGGGGNRGQGRRIDRATFESMSPVDQAAAAASVAKGEVQIV